MTTLFRKSILFTADRRPVRSFFQKYGMKLIAHRFVAAEHLKDTVEKVKELNARGLMVTLDYLGESVKDERLAAEAAGMVLQTYDAIERNKLNSNVSVKLTQLGLNISHDVCLNHMRKIAAKAKEQGNFVRIDMEDSPYTQVTIDIYNTLREEFGGETVGLVLQSYLYRTEEDLRGLLPSGPNLRIVKGAYQEPASVAFPSKSDVDGNYVRLVQIMMDNGCYAAIASHDEKIITELINYASEHNIRRDRFEFQMLYGISGQLQQRLADQGFRVRVYTPFGEQWYPYFTRRLAERPANALFVLKGLFRK
ncbi:proline dehydrogenase family protein [Paenibacillus gansuensis]|uniref:proline dehydrogenase n=1 Tax=Paenibacillus gansuensis TaxID=306542 RepID=A0ABW5PGH4_9BACL